MVEYGPKSGSTVVQYVISHSLSGNYITFFLYFIADFNTSEVTMLVFDLL